MNMKRSHRVLATALAIALATSLCGIPAYAVDAEQPAGEPPKAVGEET